MSTSSVGTTSGGDLDRGDLPGLLVSIAIAQLAGVIPAVFTASDVAAWYPTLTAPPLTPPSWVFGPVWTALFAAIGVAAYLVYRRRDHPVRTRALAAFGVQLALNVAWSFAFFGARSPAAGLAVILALDVAVLATAALFDRVDRRATALMLPYLAWVLFATYLTVGFWTLN